MATERSTVSERRARAHGSGEQVTGAAAGDIKSAVGRNPTDPHYTTASGDLNFSRKQLKQSPLHLAKQCIEERTLSCPICFQIFSSLSALRRAPYQRGWRDGAACSARSAEYR